MMKKLKMIRDDFLTLEEGCNKYLDNCRARNLCDVILDIANKILTCGTKKLTALSATKFAFEAVSTIA